MMRKLLIPKLIQVVCEYMRDNALHCKSIFRKPASLTEVQKLKTALDSSNTTLEMLQVLHSIKNIHIVANLLLMYLRNLKKPLISFEIISGYIVPSDEGSGRNNGRCFVTMKQMFRILKSIPVNNRATVLYLANFFHSKCFCLYFFIS